MKGSLGSLARKGRFVIAPGAPCTPWASAAPSSAGGSCLQGLLVSPRGLGAGVRGAGPGDRCAGRERPVALLHGFCGALLVAGAHGRQLRAPCWAVAFSFTEVLSLGDSWSLRGWQWWWSPFSRAGEHHPPCHQGRGWHLVGLVMLQMSGCARLYPAVLSTFLQIRSVNRSELSLSALFSILFPLKNFPSILGIRECHSFDASFVLLHWKWNFVHGKVSIQKEIFIYMSQLSLK